MLLALVATLDFEVHYMDMKSAILNKILEENIYIVQLESYKNNNRKGLVCKLKRAIYAFKQAQWVWIERYDIFFLHLGFRRCQAHPNIYSLKIQDVFSMVKPFLVQP